jgi:hypothetical protein
MATVRPDIIIRLGPNPNRVSGSRVATDAAQPYVEWDLPADITQRRVSVKITNVEPLGSGSFATSGDQPMAERRWQFPTGAGMGPGFEGLCTVEVAVSEGLLGEYEYISAPLYFVYDPSLDRLYKTQPIILTWEPDSSTSPRHFQVQVSADPQFATVAYETFINDEFSFPVSHTLPPSFVPTSGQPYFWRVRQGDVPGGTFNQWHRTEAFVHWDNDKPTITIDDVRALVNEFGDVEIDLTLFDAEADTLTLMLSFDGGPAQFGEQPCCLLQATNQMPPGVHTVTWRTMLDDFQAKLYTGINVHAVVSDQLRDSDPHHVFGAEIDNRYTQNTGGTTGDYTLHWRADLGYVHEIEDYDLDEIVLGVDGKVFNDRLPARHRVGVDPAPVLHNSVLAYCSLEARNFGGLPLNLNVKYPSPLYYWTALNPDGTTHTDQLAPVGAEVFLFDSPLNYAQHSDAWPKPYTSRELSRRPFLLGWEDGNGNVYEYPDGYDWDNRPASHAANEVWALGDAWVQWQELHYTDLVKCTTCNGKHWVASEAGPPYTRIPCPNAFCDDGWDTRYLAFPADGVSDKKPTMSYYIKPRWVRASRIVNGTARLDQEVYGLNVDGGKMTGVTQHVWGLHPSPLDGVYTWQLISGSWSKVLQHYMINGRKLPKEIPAPHDLEDYPTATAITRQPEGSGVDGHMMARSAQLLDSTETGKVVGEVTDDSEYTDLRNVDGYIAQPFRRFWAGTDPDSHPIAKARPTPTQFDGMKVEGRIGRYREVTTPSFLFTPPWWDAYNTIHWRTTVSDEAYSVLEVRRKPPAGEWEEWSNVRGDNCIWLSSIGAWAVPPLQTHMYLNTRNLDQWPRGWTYQLRLFGYVPPPANTTTPFTFSREFQILEDVTNPASILLTEYEPWTRAVTIRFRLDDSESDFYTITGFWFTTDDGETWQPISGGDVVGEVQHLSSTLGENVHEVTWMTNNYALSAGDTYRVRIECAPADEVGKIQLPFFKWLSPMNPSLDAAEAELVEILGRVEDRVFDEDTDEWVKLPTPRKVPGRLAELEVEYEQIREHPTVAASQGLYSFMVPHATGEVVGKIHDEITGARRWTVTNAAGRDGWLAERWNASETHSQALSRVASEINFLATVRLPELRRIITEQEIAIRKNLMRQGFFAEAYFKDNLDGTYTETYTLPPRMNETPEDAERTVTRWWRFRVQGAAEGPTGVFDPVTGDYAPEDATDLETVWYRWQMDFKPTFDSQAFSTPLRERVTNYDGTRLSVSETQGPDGEPTHVGGVYKLPPADLPGKEGDVLASGQTSFESSYRWRVAAYNPIYQPPTAKSRPRITSRVWNGDTIDVGYTISAHPMITETSMTHVHGFGETIYGFSVAVGNLSSPEWQADAFVQFLSDRRAPQTDNPSRRVNSVSWFWEGTNRTRPTIQYDGTNHRYFGFADRTDPANAQRVRPMMFWGMERDKLCDFDVVLNSETALKVSGPSVMLPIGSSSWNLFVSVKEDAAATPYVARSASANPEVWPALMPTNVTNAENPWVTHAGGALMTMFFQRTVSGKPQIFSCTSTDGLTWTTPSQITAEANGASYPSAVRVNNQWVLYYFCNDEIVSVAGATTGSMSGRQVERQATAVDGDTWTPVAPCAFVDLYQGNDELFLYYAVDGLASGKRRMRICRLEDKEWGPSFGNTVSADSGHATHVIPTRTGVVRTLSMGMMDYYAYGVVQGVTPKIRLDFSEHGPANVEFYRQGDWVDANNMASVGAVMEPASWTYNDMLNAYPYLGAVDATEN